MTIYNLIRFESTHTADLYNITKTFVYFTVTRLYGDYFIPKSTETNHCSLNWVLTPQVPQLLHTANAFELNKLGSEIGYLPKDIMKSSYDYKRQQFRFANIL